MSEENSLGSIIKTARERLGWTQQELADKFDPPVSRVTVNRWEKDVQPPSDFNIKQLISILGLNEKEADALNRASAQPTLRRRILPLQNELFTGREWQLEQLSQLLKVNTSVVLCGLPGIGKTQLALEYAHRSFPDVYRAVFWVDAADKKMLQASYDKIARKLELPEQHEHDQKRRIEAVKEWLEDHTNWLIIMDNADDLSLARSFFPSAHDGHILLTTRTQIVGNIAIKFEVEKMELEEGQLFLLRRSDRSKGKVLLNAFATDTRAAALEVVELLDSHPLALDQAGAYIEGGVSFTDYIDHYKEQRSGLLEERGPLDGNHPESVVITFDLCLEKAHEQHHLATDILRFCAFLQPDAIPDELFKHDDSFKLDRLAFKKGIEAVLRYSLMKRNAQEKTFSMHRLVQALLIDTMSPNLQMQWRVRVVRAVNAAFPGFEFVREPHPAVLLRVLDKFGARRVARLTRRAANPSLDTCAFEFVREPHPAVLSDIEFKDWSLCERLLLHVLVCAAWRDDEVPPILEASELFHKASIYLRELGFPEASILRGRILPNYSQHFVVKYPDNALALDHLANLYFYQHRYDQAEPLYQQAIAIRVKDLGTEHPDILRNLNKLAIIYIAQGKSEQAESLLRRAINLCEKHHMVKYPDTALWLLAKLLQEQGKHEQADAWYQHLISTSEQRFGKAHVFIQTVKSSYADFLRSMGRDAEAAALEVNDEPSG